MTIIDEIIASAVTWEQIWVLLIEQSEARETMLSDVHPEQGCYRKYCAHGNTTKLREQQDHTADLRRELKVIRSGVTPA